jgi:hypothetical protein
MTPKVSSRKTPTSLSPGATRRQDEDDEDEEDISSLWKILKSCLQDREISEVAFMNRVIDVVMAVNSDQPPMPHQQEEEDLLYEDLSNSSFSVELTKRKFADITNKDHKLYEKWWKWIYAIAHLPYLQKYNDIEPSDLSSEQKADLTRRQNKIASMMSTFLYEASK